MLLTPRERLLNRTARSDNGCWHWTGPVFRGYAYIRVDKRQQLAHRFAYETLVGPIPTGLTIDHLCHTNDPNCSGGECGHRSCVNPDHLEAVSIGVNVRRGKGIAAQRARTECPQGHPYEAGAPRRCLICKRQKARESYERNRELTIQRAREWRLANPERHREIAREAQRRLRAKSKEKAA